MIHNDRTFGSQTIFTLEQLNVLNNICPSAEKALSVLQFTTKTYILSSIFQNTDVCLVPKRNSANYVTSWCEGAKDVYTEWQELLMHHSEGNNNNDIRQNDIMPVNERELGEIITNSENQEEIDGNWNLDQRYDIGNTMLSPWSNCVKGSITSGGSLVLGWFDGSKIFICLDYIVDLCNNDSDKILKLSANVLLHELAHAMMYNNNCTPNKIKKTPPLYWAEEAMANKIMLDYLFAYDIKFFKDAYDFVKNQNGPYNLGLSFYTYQIGDWEIFRNQKSCFNLKESIRFLKMIYYFLSDGVLADEVNHTFYNMLNVFTPLDNWTNQEVSQNGCIQYKNGHITYVCHVNSWKEVYLNLIRILIQRYDEITILNSLPPIKYNKSSKLQSLNTNGRHGLIIDSHGSAEKHRSNIKYILYHLDIPYTSFKVFLIKP